MDSNTLNLYSDFCIFAIANKAQSLELGCLALSLLSGTAPFPVSEDAIETAQQLDLLQESGSLKFKTQPALVFFYLLNFVDENCKNFETEEDWVSFLDGLNSPRYSSINQKLSSGYNRTVCLIAHKIYSVDIVCFIAKNRFSSRVLRYTFWDLLPFVSAEPELLVSAIWQASIGVRAEQNYFSLTAAVRQRSQADAPFAHLLIDKCQGQPERLRLFVPPIFLGRVAAVELTEALEPIIKLMRSPQVEEQKIGIYCISLLHGDKDNPEKSSSLFLPELIALEKQGSDAVISQLILMWGLLIDKLPDARQKLKDLPLTHPGKDCYAALAYTIFLKIEEELNAEWLKSGLKVLSNLAEEHPGTYQNLSNALIRILPKHHDAIKAYIDDYISTATNPIKNLEGFEDLFVELGTGFSNILSAWITDWFNRDNSRYNTAAAKVLSFGILKRPTPVVLDPHILKSYTEQDLEFTLYKVVGYVYEKELLESLVYSALIEESQHDFIEHMVVELFCFYIIYNYPGSLDFIKGKKATASKMQQRVIKAIEEHFDQVFSNNQTKPKELLPSPQRLQILFDQKNKALVNLSDRSPFRKPSFLDGVSKVSVKIGKKIFTRDSLERVSKKDWYAHGGEMTSYGHSIEIPSGEFIDPVGQEYNRYLWKTFKRREK